MYNRQNLPLSFRAVIKAMITFETAMTGLITVTIIIALINPRIFSKDLVSDFAVTSLLWILIFIFILRFFYRFIVAYLFFRLYNYNFDQEEIEITQGIIARTSSILRYDRIQNLYLDQDLGDRFLGLYNVHFETAGEKSGVSSYISGLNKENANKLIEFLNLKVQNHVQSPKPAA